MHALAPVLSLLLGQTDPSLCAQVKNVHALAKQHSLDERTLLALEATYCGAGPSNAVVVTVPRGAPARPLIAPPAGANQDCIDLWIMSVLARMSGGDGALAGAIDSEVSFACSQPPRTGSLRWPSGALERDESGWWYPNGTAAKNASGWWYLTRNAARSGGDNWWYPDGKMARNSGRWYRPGGAMRTQDEIVAEACRAPSTECTAKKFALSVAPGDAKDVVVLDLAWSLR